MRRYYVRFIPEGKGEHVYIAEVESLGAFYEMLLQEHPKSVILYRTLVVYKNSS